MKVVFFCGGLGTRLREYTETLPKSMVPIGERPILWHLMRYYAYFGHKEFILCLGYKGALIKQYFFEQANTPPQTDEHGNHSLVLASPQGDNWQLTFVDTGLDANIGQRLKSVQCYIGDDETFMANYSDGLSDLPMDKYLQHFAQHNKVASFVCVRPTNSFHAVQVAEDGVVEDIRPANQADFWINGGFFIFKADIFAYLQAGEELVEQPFERLINSRQLCAYRYTGFWACMDTLKDKIAFDHWEQQQQAYWRVWQG